MKTNCGVVTMLKTCHTAYSQEKKYFVKFGTYFNCLYVFLLYNFSKGVHNLISVSSFTATIPNRIVLSLEMLVFHCRDRNSIMAFTCPYLMSHDLPSFNSILAVQFLYSFLFRCILHILDKMLVLIHNVVQNTHLSTRLCMMTKEQANLCFLSQQMSGLCAIICFFNVL